MKFNITVKHLSVGLTVSSALCGEKISIQTSGCLTSADGIKFIRTLEGLSSYLGIKKWTGLKESQIDNYLAIVRPDNGVTVYCNELSPVLTIRPKQPFGGYKAGEVVFVSHVADTEELELRDSLGRTIKIPSDCGYVFIFSHGWSKFVCYDFGVLDASRQVRRTCNLKRLFAGYYNLIVNRSLFLATDEQWQEMISWGWFPFVWMDHDDQEKLLSFAEQSRKPQPVLDTFCEKFNGNLLERIASWHNHTDFAPHKEFIDAAAKAHLANDYVASLSTVLPRIEGILRLLLSSESPNTKITQEEMAANLVENKSAFSSLIPARFKEYLLGFYFKGFQSDGDIPLSRHSVAHGVSQAADHNRENSSLAFMLLDQIAYYLTD